MRSYPHGLRQFPRSYSEWVRRVATILTGHRVQVTLPCFFVDTDLNWPTSGFLGTQEVPVRSAYPENTPLTSHCTLRYLGYDKLLPLCKAEAFSGVRKARRRRRRRKKETGAKQGRNRRDTSFTKK